MRVEDAASLGRAIAARRRAVGLTQGVLAHKVGVSAGAVVTWERGTIRRKAGVPEPFALPRERLEQLADVLDCRPADLLDASSVPDEIRTARYGVPPLGSGATIIAGERFDLTGPEADKVAAYARGLLDARDLHATRPVQD